MLRNGRARPRLRRLENGCVQRNCRIVAVKDLPPEELQELVAQETGVSDVMDQMAADQLSAAIMEINEELYSMDAEAKRSRKGLTGTKLETWKLRIAILRTRLDLLRACLAKTLPDKKSVAQEVTIIKESSADAIPDDILAKIIAGSLSPDEEERLQLLLAVPVGGEQ